MAQQGESSLPKAQTLQKPTRIPLKSPPLRHTRSQLSSPPFSPGSRIPIRVGGTPTPRPQESPHVRPPPPQVEHVRAAEDAAQNVPGDSNPSSASSSILINLPFPSRSHEDLVISPLPRLSHEDLRDRERVPSSISHSSVASSSDSSVVSLILSAPEVTEEPTNIVLDTSVATMVLDGDSWLCKPLDCLLSISGLGAAIQRVPEGEAPEESISRLKRSISAYTWYTSLQCPVHITSTVYSELKNSSQFNTQLWTSSQIEKFFILSGKIFDMKYLNKFFKKLYTRYQRKALYYQETRQGKLKFLHQGAADSIGYDHLTTAQANTRRDITIAFESAYVPNVKLLLTDDHRFLDLVAGEGEVREVFWKTVQETFRVDLTLELLFKKHIPYHPRLLTLSHLSDPSSVSKDPVCTSGSDGIHPVTGARTSSAVEDPVCTSGSDGIHPVAGARTSSAVELTPTFPVSSELEPRLGLCQLFPTPTHQSVSTCGTGGETPPLPSKRPAVPAVSHPYQCETFEAVLQPE